MSVEALDIYFGGPGDEVTDLVVTPLGERFFGVPSDIAGDESGSIEILDFGPFSGNTPEEGIMLFTNGDRGFGNRGGATEDTEALFYKVQ